MPGAGLGGLGDKTTWVEGDEGLRGGLPRECPYAGRPPFGGAILAKTQLTNLFNPEPNPPQTRCRMELIKPAVDWRKAGVKVNTMGAAVASK